MYHLFFISYIFPNVCTGLLHLANEREELRNRLVNDSIIPTSATPTNLIDCYRFCTKNQECLSISYHERLATCNIYSSLNANDSGIYQEGWRAYFQKSIVKNCPNSGFLLSASRTFCFKIFTDEIAYYQAVGKCAEQSTSLIRIDSEKKQKEVSLALTALYTSGSKFAYIQGGLYNTQHWMFADGSRITYFPWDVNYNPSQPNKQTEDEDQLAMNVQNGKWHDLVSSSRLYYICERKID